MYSEPLAYFITFTTFGTWLHGDSRGFVIDGIPGIQQGNAAILRYRKEHLTQEPFYLSASERLLADNLIRQFSEEQGWTLHALSVRSNHLHIVVTVNNRLTIEAAVCGCPSAKLTIDQTMRSIKSLVTRELRKRGIISADKKVWTKYGSTKYIFDEHYLQNAIRYVNSQDDK
ncbi:hypothetical protein FACS189427_05720 [Planctomycetales bacterium]|nr:hypothetical protein FACS1894214_3600 [Planctomycetales bacterium]GHT35736.1 hypothetical protein FACS189427_05720 [Planctomycetales bacterium]